jgi:iron-sulfur cluster repair protein YtfE (RIC family)
MEIVEENDITNYNVVWILKLIMQKYHGYFLEELPVIGTQLHSIIKIDSEKVQNIAQIYICF